MAAPGPGERPEWTRLVPGSAVLGFIFLSGGLWLGCLLAWEAGQPELGLVLLALGAFLPLVRLAARLRRRPVWALQVPEDGRRVADLVREALRDRSTTVMAAPDAGHGGVFRGCDPVLRIDEPACVLGVRGFPGAPSTTLLLLPESSDREEVDRLRVAIGRRVSPPG
jgi:hypothetical protein